MQLLRKIKGHFLNDGRIKEKIREKRKEGRKEGGRFSYCVANKLDINQTGDRETTFKALAVIYTKNEKLLGGISSNEVGPIVI